MDVTTDVAIIGAGTAGLAALAKVRKAGRGFVLIDGGELGTTCARALIMGSNRGLLRIYAERAGGKLLGACMVAPRGEHLAHLLAWAIERGLTAVDMLRVPYYHPAMEEALQAALHALVDGMGPPSSDSPELRPLIP